MNTKALAKAPKRKPEYKGERFDRTSDEKMLCRLCDKLATHTAKIQYNADGMELAKDLYYCEAHLNNEIKVGNRRIYNVRLLPKYRTYLGQLQRWQEAQTFHETQEGML